MTAAKGSRSKSLATKQIDWNFGEKHKDYIRKCRLNDFNVAEGAVRAGKTVDNVFAFAMELERSPDKIHIATGSTVGTAKIVIGESNGFGLEHIFRGRSRWGKFKGNECLYVQAKVGERIVIFAGGGKADSYKAIRGNSYGMWIATEINLHHKDTIKECFARQLAAKKSKIFWDLNPSNPKHFIYQDYIDKYLKQSKEDRFQGGYNYGHFTIFDNININENARQKVIDKYDPESAWYKRDILGLRIAAEGLIYRTFADNAEQFLIDYNKIEDLRKITIGVDFGGNKSKHTMVATGFTGYFDKIIVLSSRKIETGITAEELSRKYVDFLLEIEAKYGMNVVQTFTDSAEQVVNLSMKAELKRRGLNRKIMDSKKRTISERIKATNSLIASGRLLYTEDAKTLVDALCEAIWDDKSHEDKRLDDGTTDIDTLDAFEYSFSFDIKRLVKKV